MVFTIFNQHPNSVGETYFEHISNALYYSFMSAIASILLLIHAIFPFVLQGHGAKIVKHIYDEMSKNKRRRQLVTRSD